MRDRAKPDRDAQGNLVNYESAIGKLVDRLRGKVASFSGVGDAYWRPMPQARIIATLTRERAFLRLLELTDIDFTFSSIEGWYGAVYFPLSEANVIKLNELLDAQEVVHAARTDRI